MFFEIIGKIVVFFIVMIFLVGFAGKIWLKRKLTKFAEDMNSMNTNSMNSRQTQGNAASIEVPSIAVSLIKRSQHLHTPKTDRLVNELRDYGFEILNTYEIPEMRNVNIVSAYRNDGLFAVVYEKENFSSYELITETQNDQIYCVSNKDNPARTTLNTEINMKVLDVNSGLSEAINFIVANLPTSMNVLSAHHFDKIFLRSYQA